MNKLTALKKKFESGETDKWTYIDKIYKVHASLFDYADFIRNTNISAIEIRDNKVVMTFRDTGIKFICIKNDRRLAPFETLNFGTYEQGELDMQLELIEEGFNVLDIGGNLGWYAMNVARSKPSSQIYSFEPIPSSCRIMDENIKLNKIKNIRTFDHGFSDAEGTFDLFFDPTLSVNASLANMSGNKNVITVKCHIKKLDDFTKENKLKVDFIKCDVEGAELFVFKGGLKTLQKDKPVVFTEMLRKWASKFNYHPNEIIQLFKEINYSCYRLSENKLKPIETINEKIVETNFFFLHNKMHAKQIKKYVKG